MDCLLTTSKTVYPQRRVRSFICHNMDKMFFFYDEKYIVLPKVTLNNIAYQARLFFSDTCMFQKVSKLCPHFLEMGLGLEPIDFCQHCQIREYQGQLSPVTLKDSSSAEYVSVRQALVSLIVLEYFQ